MDAFGVIEVFLGGVGFVGVGGLAIASLGCAGGEDAGCLALVGPLGGVVGAFFVFLVLFCCSPALVMALLDGIALLGGAPPLRGSYPLLCGAKEGGAMPVLVYSDAYNITACGLEGLHPFDSTKYSRVVGFLRENGGVASTVAPVSLPRWMELHYMSYWYRARLSFALWQATVFEVPPVAFLPSFLTRWRVLEPMRLAAGGSLAAVDVAIGELRRWEGSGEPRDWFGGLAVNCSGGYHHASARFGHGFCAFPDIPLALRYAASRLQLGRPFRALVVDLDVHQGDGTARDVSDPSLFPPAAFEITCVDFFNPDLFPADRDAESRTAFPVHVRPGRMSPRVHEAGGVEGGYLAECGGQDAHYNKLLARMLPGVVQERDPDLVLYNAGTDVLRGDPLGGGVALSPQGIRDRDAIVLASCGVGAKLGADAPELLNECFQRAGAKRRPTVWLFSGGYQRETAAVIADSIAHADQSLGIQLDATKRGE